MKFSCITSAVLAWKSASKNGHLFKANRVLTRPFTPLATPATTRAISSRHYSTAIDDDFHDDIEEPEIDEVPMDNKLETQTRNQEYSPGIKLMKFTKDSYLDEERVFQTARLIEASNLKASPTAYFHIIKAYGRAKKKPNVLKWIQKYEESGLPNTRSMFFTIIQALKQIGEKELMDAWVSKVEKSQEKIENSLYGMIISCYGKYYDAENVNKWVRKFEKSEAVRETDSLTYASILYSYDRLGDLETFEKYVEKFKNDNMEMNQFILDLILKAYLKNNKEDKVRYYINKIERSKITISPMLCLRMIKTLAKLKDENQVIKYANIFENFDDFHKTKRAFAVMVIAISEVGNDPLLEKWISKINDMYLGQSKPEEEKVLNQFLYAAIAEAYSKVGKLKECKAHLCTFDNMENIRPYSFEAIFRTCGNIGDPLLLDKYVKKFEQAKVPISGFVCSLIIEAFHKCNDKVNFRKWIIRLDDSNLLIRDRTCELFIKLYQRIGVPHEEQKWTAKLNRIKQQELDRQRMMPEKKYE